eukprot:3830276-Pleurochrysis_carterae.AAC.2
MSASGQHGRCHSVRVDACACVLCARSQCKNQSWQPARGWIVTPATAEHATQARRPLYIVTPSPELRHS